MEDKSITLPSISHYKYCQRPSSERKENRSKSKALSTKYKAIYFSHNNKLCSPNTSQQEENYRKSNNHKIKSELNSKFPNLSSNIWGVFNGSNGEILFGKNYNTRREIASLTKIMTCFTVIQLSKALNIDMKSENIVISKRASLIIGTKAELEKGDKLSVYDLLFGLMLPSGNDAAIALTEHFSRLIYLKLYPNNPTFPNQISKFFIYEMNKIASLIGMKRTTFSNSHGLADNLNKSTVCDLGILASHAMKDAIFKIIVSTKSYTAIGSDILGDKKEFEWRNRNILLEFGFNGIKTGSTTTAGHCLCSSIESDNKLIIIVLLNAKTEKARFSETRKIVKYIIYNNFLDPIQKIYS